MDICQDYDLGFEQANNQWADDINYVWCVQKVLELSKQKDSENRISFDDMVWLPCAMGIVKPTFDLVTIDEAQDMNLPQLTMAQQSCRKGGRIVVVGDSRQAIYGFRGAVQDAMEMMEITLRAQVC